MKLSSYLKNFNFMDVFRITTFALPLGVYITVKKMHWGAEKKEE
jgi:hypothetical protein